MMLNQKYRTALLSMTDEMRASMRDALANPVEYPTQPVPRGARAGFCDCSCGGCSANPAKHCRHILRCGLGGPNPTNVEEET